MVKIVFNGTDYKCTRDIVLPAVGGLSKTTLSPEFTIKTNLKYTDPKSPTGKQILDKFEDLYTKLLEGKCKSQNKDLIAKWTKFGQGFEKGNVKPSTKVADQMILNILKEVKDLNIGVAQDGANAAMKQATAFVAKKTGEKLKEEKGVSIKDGKYDGLRQKALGAFKDLLKGGIKLAGGVSLATVTGGVSVVVSVVGMIGDLVKFSNSIREIMVNLNKERAANLKIIKDTAEAATKNLAQLSSESAQLAKYRQAAQAELAQMNQGVEALERKIAGWENLDFDGKNSALIKNWKKDTQKSRTAMMLTAKDLKTRKTLDDALKTAQDAVSRLSVLTNEEIDKLAKPADEISKSFQAVEKYYGDLKEVVEQVGEVVKTASK